jgi:hypothetical protein
LRKRKDGEIQVHFTTIDDVSQRVVDLIQDKVAFINATIWRKG